MAGRLVLWQSAINGRKRRNDKMGKAAHVDVGRLLSLADLGNWPRKGVMPMQNEKSAEKIYREEERWRQNIEAQHRVLRSTHDWLGSAHQ
jgi:hypothetical protein